MIDDVRAELEAPGRQVAIYGERGVGKTSLALLLYFFGAYDDDDVHIFRCDKATTFEDICGSLLAEAGHMLSINGVQNETGRTAEGRLGPFTGALSRQSTVSYRALRDTQAVNPARMLSAFLGSRGLLIVDEFDRVQELKSKTRMAELIKHFSDARSKTKIVLVGVAETLNELIGEHESLSRSLAQIGLGRMDEPELRDIIHRGAKRTGASFDRVVATKIVRLADGFPHFVHLLCLYASTYAGESTRPGDVRRPHIGEREYTLGLKSAISKCEHTLQDGYEAAVVTTRRKSDIYELTMRAMALAEERDVQVRQLAKNASYLAKADLRPEKFSNALGELIKPERRKVLTKVRDGYYKFTNPLMRPYVRFLLEFDNVVHHGGQLEFPFMRTS